MSKDRTLDGLRELLPECKALGLFDVADGAVLEMTEADADARRGLSVFAAAASDVWEKSNIAKAVLEELTGLGESSSQHELQEMLVHRAESVGLLLRLPRQDRALGLVALFSHPLNVPMAMSILRRELRNL